MSDQLINDAMATVMALQALKLKPGARIRGTREGHELHQRGKPVLLLTNEAIRDFARAMQEADNG